MMVGLARLENAIWELGLVDKVRKVLSLETKAAVKCIIGTALQQFKLTFLPKG